MSSMGADLWIMQRVACACRATGRYGSMPVICYSVRQRELNNYAVRLREAFQKSCHPSLMSAISNLLATAFGAARLCTESLHELDYRFWLHDAAQPAGTSGSLQLGFERAPPLLLQAYKDMLSS